jgi:heat shock protein HtpX
MFMKYTGVEIQQRNNNIKSLILLMFFPPLVFAMLYAILFCIALTLGYGSGIPFASVIFSFLHWTILCLVAWLVLGYFINIEVFDLVAGFVLISLSFSIISLVKSYDKCTLYANDLFMYLLPYVAFLIFFWFVLAYSVNVHIIDSVTGARALERRENKRIYNLVENLCISCGMQSPAIHIIESSALNAYASGVRSSSYTITFTRGIINELNDEELSGVIAHELTHIRNKDVRLLMISILFAGIFEFILELMLAFVGALEEMSKNEEKGAEYFEGSEEQQQGWVVNYIIYIIVFFKTVLLAAIIILPALICICLSMLMRCAISRNREYMADAGAVALTKDSKALVNALLKISKNSALPIGKESVAQLFIEHRTPERGIGKWLAMLFETHPPIEKRIQALTWL